MVGIIRRREQMKIEPFDPDNTFDPVTHIATEANFIKFLDCGIYDSKYIGYKVQLSNSVDYNNGLWVIADVNHDSTNTGQTNCYDLISVDGFHNGAFSSSSSFWYNNNCIARVWLNDTFYSGFTNKFRSHIMRIKYYSSVAWQYDNIILPSKVEITGDNYSARTEGIIYPIFTNANSRIKKEFGTDTAISWWTRSYNNDTTVKVWNIATSGYTSYDSYSQNRYLAPLLRVQ